MAIEKVWSSYGPTANLATYVGDTGEMFYDRATGNVRISDGVTPGGIPIVADGGDYGNSNVVTLLANNFGSNTIVTTGNISSGNIILTGDVGNVGSINFNTSYVETGAEPTGSLHWSSSDQTLELHHPNGVVQQVGQELYMYARNNTGNTIDNGTVVGFAGAEQNGEARIEVSPYNANGSVPSLYAIGVATQDIEDGEDGRITVWGKVRDVDMSAFTVGDILYADPATTGGFANVKPTAPNAVVSIAAVLNNDASEGEIFVRPTILPQESYGKFLITSDITIPVADTANVAVFDTTEISNGVTLGTPASRMIVNQSGYYQIDVSAQVDATGGGFSSGTMYIWIRVNGTDVVNSTRRQGVLASAPSAAFSYTKTISLDINDYVEIGYAADSTSVFFNAAANTAFAPSTTAIACGITQVQL
jgi:hypothetical protein